ncbi:MAG TPA: adenylate/guanylate cyclase domain-containing protein [Spirochaetia bacterium]|nr:adenylate/guanylate cyclase domain-containing protein [Spirochaetia bacterium]
MSIRLKIILIVVPLMIATLALTAISSFFSATNGITRVAKEFLEFKADELSNQAQSQWNLLVENNLSDKPEMIVATKAAVQGYAQSIIRSPTEVILAFDSGGAVAMSTSDFQLKPGEVGAVSKLIAAKSTELTTIRLGGQDRVVKGFWFDPFGWYLLVTEERGTFYSQVNEITVRSAIILGAAIVVALGLMMLFAGYLTRPLKRVGGTMQEIMATNDLSKRVAVEYHDEIGGLAQTFNLMVGGLERAYGQIKNYAFKAVLAEKKEQKIRNIFQKYVPKHVIEEFFKNPDQMLVGKSANLSILFSDIRSFTSIAEKLRPAELVDNLNRYFHDMVDVITARNGIIDKYVGDAIMAFFGAPVESEDTGLQSVSAGLEMIDTLAEFNRKQKENGQPQFQIGIGINFGDVIVGNMGTEKKMDYTVMGDNVNLASRLEGLTKQYHQGIIISQSLYEKVHGTVPCRWLDLVAVKGKTLGVKIYGAKRALEAAEREAWDMHNAAMQEYQNRNFGKAARMFEEVGRRLPGDFASAQLGARCALYDKDPPPAQWDGVEVMKTK